MWRLLEHEQRTTLAAKDAQFARAVADADAIVAAKDQTISELSTDVAYLRQHLDQISEQLDQSRRELAVLHQSTAIRLEALTAGMGDQREDAPTASPEAPGATEGVSEGDPPSWFVTAWRKVRGS